MATLKITRTGKAQITITLDPNAHPLRDQLAPIADQLEAKLTEVQQQANTRRLARLTKRAERAVRRAERADQRVRGIVAAADTQQTPPVSNIAPATDASA